MSWRNLIIRSFTLADARWLGSSLDWSAPTPRLGSWVWKTDIRPPVGDSSLKAACRAEPRADWVSMVFSNKVGRLFRRSCTSWKTNIDTLLIPEEDFSSVISSFFHLQRGQRPGRERFQFFLTQQCGCNGYKQKYNLKYIVVVNVTYFKV